MATQQTQLAQREGIIERRGRVRVAPDLLTYVSFQAGAEGAESGNGGMMLDISEGGVAVATALAIPDATTLRMEIAGDASHMRMELRGRVAWVSESKRRVGLQFVEMGAAEREALRKWIGGRPQFGEIASSMDDPANLPQVLVKVKAASADAAVHNAAIPISDDAPGSQETARQETPTREAASHRATTETAPVNKTAMVAAFVAVIAASFWAGLEIGRSVLGARNGSPLVANSSAAGGSTLTASALPSAIGKQGLQPAPAATSPAGSAGAADWLATPTARAGAPASAKEHNTEIGANAGGGLEKAGSETKMRADSDVAAGGSAGPAGAGPDAEPSKLTPAPSMAAVGEPGRSEWLVTPEVGEAPTRVEQAEMIVVQSASLEIRSRRFALVPAVAEGRAHKVKRERLVVGPLLARVTPQVSEAALGRGAGASGEQVVRVRATIAGDGHVSYVDPVDGPVALIPIVMSAVREWKFAPSTLDGEPVETEADLTITFRRVH